MDALHKTDLMPEHRDFFLSLLSIYKVLGIGGLFLCRPLVCSFVYRTPWTTQVLGDPAIRVCGLDVYTDSGAQAPQG